MLSASLCSYLRYNIFRVKRNSDHMITKLDFNSDYKLSKDCNYALHGPLWAGKIQGLHAFQWTWLPACLSTSSCDIGTQGLGNDFTGQITFIPTEERCDLPRGCSALQLHLTLSHHLPANLSGRFYNAGRKQKSTRHIG